MRTVEKSPLYWPFLIISLELLSTLIAPNARALDSRRSIKQYVETVWTRDQGVPAGISKIIQDRAGFLWIAARDGLYRFDGLTFQKLNVRSAFDQSPVESMAVARDGSVWIGRDNGAIEVYHDGALHEVPHGRDGNPVPKIVQSADGTIWAEDGGSRDFPLMRLKGGRLLPVGADFGLPRDEVRDLTATGDGALWTGFVAHDVIMRLPPGSHRFEPVPIPVKGRVAFSEDRSGKVWLSDDLGTRVIWTAGHLVPGSRLFPTPAMPRGARVTWDRDGNLWGRSEQKALFRLSNPFRRKGPDFEVPPGTVEFDKAGGSTNILIDTQDDLWTYSGNEIHRLRNGVVVSEPALVNATDYGDLLTSTTDGTVYVAEHDAIYRIVPNGRPVTIREHSGDPDVICPAPDQSIVAAYSNKIVRLNNAHMTSLGYPPKVGPDKVRGCAFDARGVLWISTEHGGMFSLRGGKWSGDPLSAKFGGPGSLNLVADATGKLVVVWQSGVVSILDSPAHIDFRIGPDPAVDYPNIVSVSPRRVLVAGPSGVAILQGGRLKAPPPWQDVRFRNLEAIIDTPDDETWMKGAAGIYRAETREFDAAFDHPHSPLHLRLLDRVDGADDGHVQDSALNVARGGDGRIWFGGSSGTRWIDPGTNYRNTVPPGVVVSQLTADGHYYLDPTLVRLPAATSSIEIGFAALGLGRPDKVTALYRLRGVDRAWINPGTRRSAFYLNLLPGDYVFELKAANEDGVWTDHAATVRFTLPATFLQSAWFKIILATIVIAMLALAYHMRVRNVAGQIRRRIQDRMAERERIAHDLHDTMLQGFQGMVLRFHALLQVATLEAEDRRKLQRAVDQADAQLDEGRRELYQLRDLGLDDNVVEHIRNLGQECSQSSRSAFVFSVQGNERALAPVISTEIERIAIEALRNAFAHSGANTISTTIRYDLREFVVEVSDDGRGIPAMVLHAGKREGHLGLVIMRQRAGRIGGRLTLESSPGRGTLVVLRVPARVAYQQESGILSDRYHRLLARLSSPFKRRA